MPPLSALQLITDAFLEAGIFSAGEPLPAEDAQFGLSKLSRMLDEWDASRLNVFAVDFLEYTLIPSVQPLLIGQAFEVTKVAANGGVATFTANNTFAEGQLASTGAIGTIGGVNFDLSNALVQSATPTQFTLACGAGTVAATAVDGQAIYPGAYSDIFPHFSTLTQRPAKIENANIVLNNVNPTVNVPLRIRNADWWAANPVPNIGSTVPTDLYYEPKWPNGFLYLWPEPTTNYGLQLNVWVNLADVPSLTYPFSLPQGYRNAVTYSLAESLCPSYGRPLDPTLARMAQNSRASIMARNSKSLNIVTQDAGIPSGRQGKTFFNWMNGTVTPQRGGY